MKIATPIDLSVGLLVFSPIQNMSCMRESTSFSTVTQLPEQCLAQSWPSLNVFFMNE